MSRIAALSGMCSLPAARFSTVSQRLDTQPVLPAKSQGRGAPFGFSVHAGHPPQIVAGMA